MTGLVGVNSEIVSCAVCTANTLRPTIAIVYLSIPAVRCVMGHLVRHVLPETKALRVDADLHQELVDSGNEVTECLVGNDTLIDGLADCDLSGGVLACFLNVAIEDGKLHIANLVKAFVLFVVRVHIMLDLCHGELADAEETSAWRNFITERAANLGGSKGYATVVELE